LIRQLADYLDSRLGYRRHYQILFERRLPAGINYFHCFGGISFFLLLLQLLTGALLSLYYVPSEAEAYQSLLYIHYQVRLGWLVRSIHSWTSSFLLITLMVHTARVFIQGAYKNPRELNWIIGVLLFLATLAFAFTGYLLPWNQRSYWATTVGINMIRSLPLLGDQLAYLFMGAEEIGGLTLLRFYSLHVLWLPIVTGILLWLHFHMIRQQGLANHL